MQDIINAELFPVPSAKVKAEAQSVLDGGGWIYIHAYISKLTRTANSAGVLLYMVNAERKGKNRPYVINRLYRSFAHIRRSLEEAALYATAY
jgi:hypothetical protein